MAREYLGQFFAVVLTFTIYSFGMVHWHAMRVTIFTPDYPPPPPTPPPPTTTVLNQCC